MITISKHHGLGNDFLVCDTSQVSAVVDWANLAKNWCHRRHGVGADGLLLLTVNARDDLTMVLYNADGSRAEMSGNGIRCLAQAAHIGQRRQGPTDYVVNTDAGRRDVHVEPIGGDVIEASVSMGAVGAMSVPDGWSAIGVDPLRPVAHLSLGNPHTVVGVDDVISVDLRTLGEFVPQVNLEIIEAGEAPSIIRMRVHERGAGITQACGTGACASAWAAAEWGLAVPDGDEILVQMDGGDARVRLNHPEPGHVTLIGPAVFVATIQIEDARLQTYE